MRTAAVTTSPLAFRTATSKHPSHVRLRLRFRRSRQGRPGPDEHRQDASRDRAVARPFVRHHRLPAAVAGTRELRPYGRDQGRALRRADHRRGEDHPARGAVVLLHRGGDAARPAHRVRRGGRNPALRRSRPRPRVHRPAAARARHGGDDVPGRGDDRAADPPPGARGADRNPAAPVATVLRRAGQAGPPAAAHRRRRVQRGRDLCAGGTDPAPERRLRGGHGPPVAAHPQRPGGAVPGARGRFPGRHRRDRHGPEHERRSRRVRRPGQVRRPPAAPADGVGGRSDRRPRRTRHEGRHLRHDDRMPADPRRSRRGGRGAQFRLAGDAVLAQQRPGFLVAGLADRQPERAAAAVRA